MEQKYTRYKRYDLDFKKRAVELLESSARPMAEVAQELGIPYKTLERWKTQLRQSAAQPSAATGKSAEELARQLEETRRQLTEVREERDILKKALAICTRETPKRNSTS
jgi:transposase